MFLQTITMHLWLLMILNRNDVVAVSQLVNPFAVKRPSNQLFTNEGTEVTCPCTRTQLEYSNVEKSTDPLTRIKIIRRIKLSIGGNVDIPLLIEKTNGAYPLQANYDFKGRHGRREDVSSRQPLSKGNLDREFLNEATSCYQCIRKHAGKKTTRKSNLFLINKYRVENGNSGELLQRRSFLKKMLYDRSKHSAPPSIWKSTIYNLTDPSSLLSEGTLLIVPSASRREGHSKVSLESQRPWRHERLANKLDDLTGVKINLHSIRVVKAHDGLTYYFVPRPPKRKLNRLVLRPNFKEDGRSFEQRRLSNNISPSAELDQSETMNYSDIDEFTNSAKVISQLTPSIETTIEPGLINSLHVLDRTPRIFGTNFRTLPPQHFVLAPTKFVDDVKILPSTREFSDLDETEFIKTSGKGSRLGVKGMEDKSESKNSHEVKYISQSMSAKETTPGSAESNARYSANYSFYYRVADEETANYLGHQESRSEGVTNGQYHALLPDGRIQRVTYRVDNEGYRANVSYHRQPNPLKDHQFNP